MTTCHQEISNKLFLRTFKTESELEVLSVNDCFSLPCQHGGECRLLLPAPGFRCLCAPGYQAYNK